jgi:hypothetical protein
MACELFASLGDFKSMMDLTSAVQEADDVASRDKAVINTSKRNSRSTSGTRFARYAVKQP